ncbi:MAG: hypothetical protein Q9218_007885 [Villophora microphyllina]
MAGPSPADIQYQLAHIHDDRSNAIIAAFSVTLTFAIITVLLRFVSRHITRAPLASDDWTIVVGLTIDASIVLYMVSLALTKISILLLYRRVFPKRGFHALLWAVGAFISAFTVANVLLVIFSCRPIRGAWSPFIKAKCINSDAAILAVAVMSIVTDFIILALPQPLVWKLHLPKVQRLQLTGVFLIGTFDTGVSIYRATQVTGVAKSDISYTSVNRSMWSGVQICVAIVCANLATLRPILNYLRTGKATSTVNTSASRGTSSYTGRSDRRRWTWRNIRPHSDQPVNDGTFHRLEHQPGAQSTDDVERQKYERYLMSLVSSPSMPDTAHFGDSDWGRPQTKLLPDNRV